MDREGRGCSSFLTQNTKYGLGLQTIRNLLDFAQKSSAHRWYLIICSSYQNFCRPRHALGIKLSKSEDHYLEYKYKRVYGHEGSCWLVLKRRVCPADISTRSVIFLFGIQTFATFPECVASCSHMNQFCNHWSCYSSLMIKNYPQLCIWGYYSK